MPCFYALLFCHNLVLSFYVSNRRSFDFTHGVLSIALSKYCSISLQFCLAGGLPTSSSTMLVSSLPEKAFLLKMILLYFSILCGFWD